MNAVRVDGPDRTGLGAEMSRAIAANDINIRGVSAAALERVRRHELVHVGQYERWGPAFVPVYLFHSLRLWLAGKDAYRDNPFEKEAYQRTQPS